MDNSRTFRSQQLKALCDKWNVSLRFRCAHRPSGNGIIERNHRTIKSLAARTGKAPVDMVFWYNSAPLDDPSGSVPAAVLHTYHWRNPDVERLQHQQGVDGNGRYSIGDAVFVKPAQARCTTRWLEGVVTGAPSDTCVEVDGMPRHVADCRAVRGQKDEQLEEIVPNELGEQDPVVVRRSERTRHLPAYLNDYDMT